MLLLGSSFNGVTGLVTKQDDRWKFDNPIQNRKQSHDVTQLLSGLDVIEERPHIYQPYIQLWLVPRFLPYSIWHSFSLAYNSPNEKFHNLFRLIDEINFIMLFVLFFHSSTINLTSFYYVRLLLFN